MRASRALILITTALTPLAFAAWGQSPPASGISTSNGVMTMAPVSDSDQAADASVGVARAATGHYLTATDHDLYTKAFKAADRKDWTTAQSLAIQGHDATARRLIEWRYLLDRNSGAPFSEIDAFLRNYSGWPLHSVMLERAEQAMPDTLDPHSVISWFSGRTPSTGIGKMRLGNAMIAAGQVSAGDALIRQAWVEDSFQADEESQIIAAHGDLLTPELEEERLNHLLWRDDIGGAKRQMARVSDDAQGVADARLTLARNPSAGLRMARILLPRLRDNPGLLFDEASAYTAQNKPEEAAALLARVGTAPAKDYPAKYWRELHITVQQAIALRDYRTAYAVADGTGLTSGEEFAQAEFLAGWIALRYLHDPSRAMTHFERLTAGVSRPISLSRGEYWQGRAAEAAGDNSGAYRHYRAAANHGDTFYGQLALARIEAAPILRLNGTVAEPPASHAEFDDAGTTKAMKVLADLDEESLLRLFVIDYVNTHPDARHVALIGQTMDELGYPEIALRAAKTASYSNVLLLKYSHPVIPIPAYSGPDAPPEPALVLGLIRQETEFNPLAVSGAGALGIMQVLPSSGRLDARTAGLPYRPSDLLYDTSYNMKLGMVEIAKNIDDWEGSYILAIAAYNAGPGNVRKWLATYGDPRTPGVDPIDWIESIPFSETRNYVERVIENMNAYRNRIAGSEQPLKIMADLYRPYAPPRTAALRYPAAATDSTAASGTSTGNESAARMPASPGAKP